MHEKKKPATNSHNFLDKSGSESFFKSKNNALPPQLQQNLESSMQQDFSGVEIHKDSERARELNALAFAEGEAIHFAPGQFDPGSTEGKNLIGHEFAHVAQQRDGSVQPTNVMHDGTALNDDKSLEHDADKRGENAAAGNSISMYHSSPMGIRNSVGAAQAKGNVAQLAKQTSHYGEWFDDTYSLIASGQRRGVDMTLRFKPGPNVDAELIGLTQTHQAIHNGAAFYLNSDQFYKGHAIQSADAINNKRVGLTDEGTHIDRVKQYNNPIYPVQSEPSASLADTNVSAGWGQHGFRFTDSATKTLKQQDAKLIDSPAVGSVDMRKNSAQVFETAAIATKGRQAGTYYGSVQWGWTTDAAGAHKKIDFKVVSQGAPSSTFFKAAGIWNAGKSSTGADTVDLPIVDVKLISNPAGVDIGLGPVYTHLPPGTRVRELPVFVSMIETMIEVVDGPFIGETGKVRNSDLSDERP